MKHVKLISSLVALSLSSVSSADVLFSEYIEGSSNNKALELYNSGDQDISLSDYSISIYFNGATSSSNTISLSGTLAAQSTYTIVNPNASSELLAKADVTANVNFNGDDAVVLFNDVTIVDAIGKIGEDPGSQWTLNGVSTQNETLERLETFSVGDVIADDDFDPSSEWIAKGTDNFSGLGARIGEPDDTPNEPTDGTLESPCVNCPDLAPVADPDSFDYSSFYGDVIDAVALLSAEPSTADVANIKALLNDTASLNQVNLTYSEVWSALTATDEDPNNSDNVILIYSGRSIAKTSNGSGAASTDPDNWNREHSWPSSKGFSDDSFEAYTDIHHLRPADISVNSTRSNLDFDVSDNAIDEAPGSFVDGDSFEPRDEVKGDIARMMMYMDTRYEGETGDDTPDLVLVDSVTSSGQAALGKICTLLEWHAFDPVDDVEIARHDKIYQYQGNRNPYVDNPDWVDVVYPESLCDDTDDPVDPVDPSSSPMLLTAIFDGDLSGGLPKGVEIYVTEDIADLSVCGLGSANNGGGTDGQEFTFPADSATAGTFLYVASESEGFQSYFNFVPDYTSSAMSINGDDAVELFCGGSVIDVYGDPDTNGDFEAWDYTDSYAKRVDMTNADGSFNPDNWVFAGRSATDGVSVGDEINLGSFEFAPAELFISEYIEGSSFNKAIEIVNLGGSDIDLTGYQVIGYQNGNTSTGYTIDLEGTISAKSVFVLAHSSADATVLDLADQVSGSLNFNGDDAVTLVKDGEVIDSLGQIGFDPGSQWGSDLTSTQDNTLVRLLTVTQGDTDAFDEFDPSLEWIGFERNTFDNLGKYDGFDDGTDPVDPVVDIGACFDEATLISAVQSSGDSSPLVGDVVVIEGVVSHVVDELGGFFMQEEDADHDTDFSTSEGIFVNVQDNAFDFVVGDIARVKGTVEESFSRTQLLASEALLACGQAAISPVYFTMPFTEDFNLEALEGMLVSNENELIVTGTDDYIIFGETVLASERLFTPTHLYSPGSEEAIALEQNNELNQIILDDNQDGTYNTPGTFGDLSPTTALRTGTTVQSSQYIMDYSFSNYRLRPVGTVNYLLEERPAVDILDGNVKIASFNVLNLFNGDGLEGSFPGARGADTFIEYSLQLEKIVIAISELDASVIGLMEIENDGYDELSSIAQLVDALNAYAGDAIYSFVDAGEIQGTDEISVGLIYRNDQVIPLDALQVLDSSNSISDDDGVLFDDSRNRPSFAQMFETLDTKRSFVVNVNHFKSKGSSCGDLDDDATTGQGNCNLTRTRAAQALHIWLAQTFPEQPIVIVGDLNAYAKEDPITELVNAGYVDVARELEGPKAYSYSFNNQFGSLDYALTNSIAQEFVTGISEWHINADELAAFDYSETFGFSSVEKPDSYIDISAYRSSDHDPIVIALQLDKERLFGDVNGNDRLDIFDYIIILKTRGAVEGSRWYFESADLNQNGIIDRHDRRLWIYAYIDYLRSLRRR